VVRILVLDRRSDLPDLASFTEFRLFSSIKSGSPPLLTDHSCVGCADKIIGCARRLRNQRNPQLPPLRVGSGKAKCCGERRPT